MVPKTSQTKTKQELYPVMYDIEQRAMQPIHS